MKTLIMLAAVAVLLSMSACKKADKTEAPVEQTATEQVAEAAQAVEAAAAPVETVKAE